jgi:transcriptional regulator with XRE-family HTH domain
MAEQIIEQIEEEGLGENNSSSSQIKTKCEPNLTLGKTLKRYRLKAGLKQRQVAELSGISATQYSHYENGIFSPDFTKLISLAEALNCDPVALITTAIISVDKNGKEMPLAYYERTSEAFREKLEFLSSLSVVL